MLTPEQAAVVIEFARSIVLPGQKVINYQPWVAGIISQYTDSSDKEILAKMQAELERTRSLLDCGAVIQLHTLKRIVSFDAMDFITGAGDERPSNKVIHLSCHLLYELQIRSTIVSYLAFMLGTLEPTSPVSTFRGQFDVLRLLFNYVMASTPAFTEKSILEPNAPKITALGVVSFFKAKNLKGQPAREKEDLFEMADDATLDLYG